jgi:hypothetical protein
MRQRCIQELALRQKPLIKESLLCPSCPPHPILVNHDAAECAVAHIAVSMSFDVKASVLSAKKRIEAGYVTLRQHPQPSWSEKRHVPTIQSPLIRKVRRRKPHNLRRMVGIFRGAQPSSATRSSSRFGEEFVIPRMLGSLLHRADGPKERGHRGRGPCQYTRRIGYDGDGCCLAATPALAPLRDAEMASRELSAYQPLLSSGQR